MTPIHPESYEIAKEIMKELNLDDESIGKPSTQLILVLWTQRS